MEFSARVAAALAHLTFFDPCCMKAELYALLKGFGALGYAGGRRLLSLESRDVAPVRKACALLKDLVDARFTLEQAVRPGIGGGRLCRAVVAEPADVDAALALFGGQGPFGASAALPALTRSACCRDAFLRGLFLANGYLADPERQYLLEFTFSDRAHAAASAAVLRRAGVRARLVARKRSLFVLYAKSGDAVATFLGRAGAVEPLLAFENLRAVRATRGDVNRQTNFETANIGRAAAAAGEQVARLARFRDEGRLDELPEPLRETAELRLRLPLATLAEIAAASDPPVSKPTAAYRLRRLMALVSRAEPGSGRHAGRRPGQPGRSK